VMFLKIVVSKISNEPIAKEFKKKMENLWIINFKNY
jgi:hypothetical protein